MFFLDANFYWSMLFKLLGTVNGVMTLQYSDLIVKIVARSETELLMHEENIVNKDFLVTLRFLFI